MENSYKYPNLAEAKESIKKLDKYDWEKYNEKESLEKHNRKIYDKLFSDNFAGIPNILFPVEEENPPFKFDFYRVRPLEEFLNVSAINEYSYPPIEFCTKVQRVNYPKHPVFYASENPITSLAEVIKSNHHMLPEKDYCISKWCIKNYKGLNIAPFLYNNYVNTNNPYIDIVNSIYERMHQVFNELSSDQIEAIKARLEFYSNSFLNDEKYSISTYIGHQYMFPLHNFRADIFMYPSVQLDKKFINFAIHPDVVDERMSLNRVYVGKIDKLDLRANLYGLSISKYAQVNDGIFDWKEIKLNDEIYKQYLKEDFGEATQSIFIPIQN